MRKLTLILLIILNTITAGEGGAFLEPGFGPRAIGMGKAFTAIANDTYAPYWNPAGLAQITKSSYSLTSYDWHDTTSTYLGNVTNFGKYSGSLGFALVNCSSTPIDMFDSAGNPLGKSTDIWDRVAIIAYGRNIGDLSIGLSMKYIKTQLIDVGSTGLGYDFGLLYNIDPTEIFNLENPLYPVKIGLLVKDVGDTKLDYGYGVIDQISQQIRLGISTHINKSLLISIENWNSNNRPDELHYGVEYIVVKDFALRAGLQNIITNTESMKHADIYTFGTSIKMNDYEFDYSLVMHPEDTISYFSINYIFGREKKDPDEIETAIIVAKMDKEARILIKQKKLFAANKIYYQILELSPDSLYHKDQIVKTKIKIASDFEKQANREFTKANYEKSLRLYEKIERYNKTHKGYKAKIQLAKDVINNMKKGINFLSFKKYNRALKFFTEVKKLNSRDPLIDGYIDKCKNGIKARKLIKEGKYSEAVQFFDKAAGK